GPSLRGENRALVVERVSERIDHTSDQRLAHGNGQQCAGRADLVSFSDFEVIAKDDDADGILFQVEHESARAVLELDHLTRHGRGESVHARDAVADCENAADLARLDLAAELFNLTLDD